MLYRIDDSSQYTNPISIEAKRFIELSWCGVLTNLSFNDIFLVEYEVVKACALGDKVSAADVSEMLGVKYFSNEEMKTYFTKDFPLEFIVEETNKKIDCQKIYRLEFNTSPVMDEDEQEEEEQGKVDTADVLNDLVSDSLFSPNRTLKKDIHKELLDLKYWVRDFADIGSTDGETLLDRLDKVINMVHELEV